MESERLLELLPGAGWGPPPRWCGDARLASAFACEVATEAVLGAAFMAARRLVARRGGGELVCHPGAERAAFDRELVNADLGLQFFVDDAPPALWADLSGYYRTADERWVQLHCNFPHHAAGVLAWLATRAPGPQANPATRASVQAALATLPADQIESELTAAGMVAAKLRTLAEWKAHHPPAPAPRPIHIERLAPAAPRDLATLRCLDLSRVLAGPIAGRTLAAIGADVLRIGAAHLPHVEPCTILTGPGKRNAHLDLRRAADRARFEALLATTNVLIDAYRPGALAGLGYPPERLAALAPGLVLVELSAFDHQTAWANRRGFDSIVQSTTGLALEGAHQAGAQTPTPLPVQLLDFATGYLAATAACALAVHQAEVGGAWRARLSLQATRDWLVGLAPPRAFTPAKPHVTLADARRAFLRFEGPFGALLLPPQPFGLASCADRTNAPTRLGSAPPVW